MTDAAEPTPEDPSMEFDKLKLLARRWRLSALAQSGRSRRGRPSLGIRRWVTDPGRIGRHLERPKTREYCQRPSLLPQ
jgi:hypothetical protein